MASYRRANRKQRRERHYSYTRPITREDLVYAEAIMNKANVPKFAGRGLLHYGDHAPLNVMLGANSNDIARSDSFSFIVGMLASIDDGGEQRRRRNWARRVKIRARKHPEIIEPVEAAFKLGGLSAADTLLEELMTKTNKRACRRNG